MSNKISQLSWDSNFFGYPIGKIQIQNSVLDEDDLTNLLSENQDYDLITLFHQQDLSSSFKLKSKISYKEVKRTYILNIDHEPLIKNAEYNIISISDFDRVNEVFYLSLIAGRDSRFKNDPQMKYFEFEKLYFEWIFRSIKKQFDTDVFVYSEGNKYLGLLTTKIKNDSLVIGLISTDSRHQKKGIGTKLIDFLKLLAFKKNCKEILVSTQKINQQACFFYEKNGFILQQESFISHFWRHLDT